MNLKVLDKQAGAIKPDRNKELEDLLRAHLTRILVVGCGGGGNNTISRLTQIGVKGIETLAINTDAQDLLEAQSDDKLLIGRTITRGLGGGSNPQVGEESARENQKDIAGVLERVDMVFVTCGLGGGTGTGSAPIVAELAKKAGALTIGVVTLPFWEEGVMRWENARSGLEKLQKHTDTIIIIPNDRLLDAVPDLPLSKAFKVADEVLVNAVRGVTELITGNGLVNLDFADVRAIMQDSGPAMIGIGEAEGANCAQTAVELAMRNPLLDMDIMGAKNALINVTGGEEMTLKDARTVMRAVAERLDPSARVIWGARVDPALGGALRVMLIVTGFDTKKTTALRVERTAIAQRGNIDHFNAARPIPTTAPPPPRMTGQHGMVQAPPRPPTRETVARKAATPREVASNTAGKPKALEPSNKSSAIVPVRKPAGRYLLPGAQPQPTGKTASMKPRSAPVTPSQPESLRSLGGQKPAPWAQAAKSEKPPRAMGKRGSGTAQPRQPRPTPAAPPLSGPAEPGVTASRTANPTETSGSPATSPAEIAAAQRLKEIAGSKAGLSRMRSVKIIPPASRQKMIAPSAPKKSRVGKAASPVPRRSSSPAQMEPVTRQPRHAPPAESSADSAQSRPTLEVTADPKKEIRKPDFPFSSPAPKMAGVATQAAKKKIFANEATSKLIVIQKAVGELFDDPSRQESWQNIMNAVEEIKNSAKALAFDEILAYTTTVHEICALALSDPSRMARELVDEFTHSTAIIDGMIHGDPEVFDEAVKHEKKLTVMVEEAGAAIGKSLQGLAATESEEENRGGTIKRTRKVSEGNEPHHERGFKPVSNVLSYFRNLFPEEKKSPEESE